VFVYNLHQENGHRSKAQPTGDLTGDTSETLMMGFWSAARFYWESLETAIVAI
jgi:hypothetical protein